MQKNVRVNLMLDPLTLQVIDDLAAMTGESRSSMVRSLLREAHPQLVSLVERMQLIAKAGEAERKKGIERADRIANKLKNNVQLGIDSL